MKPFPTRYLLRILCGALVLGAALKTAAAERPNLLVVASYHVGMPWTDHVIAGLHDRLADHAELVISQLDVKRFPPQDHDEALVRVVAAKSAMSRPQIVIAIDDYAYEFVLRHRDIFPANAPLVFGGVNYWDGKSAANCTGVVEAIDLAATVNLALRLHPKLQNLVVVNDGSETGRAIFQAFQATFPQGLPCATTWIGNGTFAETEARLARVNTATDAVLLLSWNLDGAGHVQSYEDAIRRAHSASNAAIYGAWDFYFGHGIVGGELLDGRVHGQEVGALVDQILLGTRASAIPVVTRCRTRLAVDHRELLHHQIPLSLVPPSAEIAFREETYWEKHAMVILAALIVVVLQTITISWLVVSMMRRRQAKESLRQSEKSLRLTLDSIEEAVLVSTVDGAVARMNPASERLTGWSGAQAVGRPIDSILVLLNSADRQPAHLQTLAAQSSAAQTAQRFILPSRSLGDRIVVPNATALVDDAGRNHGTVWVLRDITDLLQLEDKLHQSQKMESIGQLAGGIAHDFNNILAIIVGYGELLKEQLQQQPQANDDLQTLLNGAKRAKDLVQQILTFSRPGKREMKPVVVQNIVAEVIKFLRSTVPSSLEFHTSLSNDLPLVLADEIQVQQVVMNLAANATHAMRGRPGRLEIRLEPIQADAKFLEKHPGLRDGEYVCITVSDTGHGMDAATLKRIFEPFFTTKVPGEGTGLGLAMVHGIVKAHQGAITVHSTPGIGTVFCIYLPALSLAADPGAIPADNLPHGHGERLLLIDDEPDVSAATRRIAELLGYRVTCFNDPLAAMDHFRDHSDGFDLIVTDLTMPSATGLDVALAATRIRADIPIVLATGYAADVAELTVHPRGIRKLILKPFTATVFAQTLHEVMEGVRSSESTSPIGSFLKPPGHPAPA